MTKVVEADRLDGPPDGIALGRTRKNRMLKASLEPYDRAGCRAGAPPVSLSASSPVELSRAEHGRAEMEAAVKQAAEAAEPFWTSAARSGRRRPPGGCA